MTPVQIDKALAYNRRAPVAFLDQTTWVPLAPATEQGVAWVAERQRQLELGVDGCLGPATQAALVQRYGPLDTRRHTQHPLPVFVARWGYDHAHDVDDLAWPSRSPAFEAATDDGSWQSGMVRLVAGWAPSTRTFSRAPDSYISLDGGSFGLAHYWSSDALPLIEGMARALPSLARLAYGPHLETLYDTSAMRRLLGRTPGKRPHEARLGWLVAGWRLFARDKAAIALQVEAWLQDKVSEGRELAKWAGWRNALASEVGGVLLAACVRMCNSGAGNARRWISAARDDVGPTAAPLAVLERAYRNGAPRGYGKPERWRVLTTWREFRGPAPREWR